MSTYAAGLEIAARLTAAGIRAVTDPRSAVPPCVLVTPPAFRYDLACGRSLDWALFALVPPPATADSWKALDVLVDAVADVLTIERVDPSSYILAAGADPLPAYRITVTDYTLEDD